MASKLVSLVSVLAMFAANMAGADSYNPQVGQRHPEFTLPNIQDGKPIWTSRRSARRRDFSRCRSCGIRCTSIG